MESFLSIHIMQLVTCVASLAFLSFVATNDATNEAMLSPSGHKVIHFPNMECG